MGLKDGENLNVTCPCCQAKLVIDPVLGAVLSHEAHVRPGPDVDLTKASSILEEQKRQPAKVGSIAGSRFFEGPSKSRSDDNAGGWPRLNRSTCQPPHHFRSAAAANWIGDQGAAQTLPSLNAGGHHFQPGTRFSVTPC